MNILQQYVELCILKYFYYTEFGSNNRAITVGGSGVNTPEQ